MNEKRGFGLVQEVLRAKEIRLQFIEESIFGSSHLGGRGERPLLAADRRFDLGLGVSMKLWEFGP